VKYESYEAARIADDLSTFDFLSVDKSGAIYFRGSTKERTRLYRMAVGLNLEELSRTYDIYAEVIQEDQFIPFQKNLEISAFLVKRKDIKILATFL
jgi:hypothetical protein